MPTRENSLILSKLRGWLLGLERWEPHSNSGCLRQLEACHYLPALSWGGGGHQCSFHHMNVYVSPEMGRYDGHTNVLCCPWKGA
jgi:hypothetical protein